MDSKRIIKADQRNKAQAAALNLADFAAEARGVVLDARKDAARIVAEARANVDAIQRTAREEAYAEGFARGQNDGYADGCEQAKRETAAKYATQYAELMALAKKTVATLADAPETLLRQASGEVLEMALMLAEKIVRRVAVRDPQAARENLRKALALADFGATVIVRVNPRQLDALRETLSEFTDALDADAPVQIVADSDISPGGVVLETSNGKIDAGVERQMQTAAAALLGDRDENKSPHEGRYAPTPSRNQTTSDTHARTNGNV